MRLAAIYWRFESAGDIRPEADESMRADMILSSKRLYIIPYNNGSRNLPSIFQLMGVCTSESCSDVFIVKRAFELVEVENRSLKREVHDRNGASCVIMRRDICRVRQLITEEMARRALSIPYPAAASPRGF